MACIHDSGCVVESHLHDVPLVPCGLPRDSLGLPKGMPPVLTDELAWVGQQYQNDHSYIFYLSAEHLAEINSALQHFKSLEQDGDMVNRDNFPLPTLGSKLEGVSRDLHEGRGFAVIRGIQPGHYPVEDQTIIWLGLQAYIAEQRARQDHVGNMLVHIVADDSSEAKAGHHRHSTSAITFHNEEAADIVGWYTRSTAASGGRCIIASAYTVYNVLAACRPDLVRTLAKADWPFAFPSFQCRPVIFYQGTKLAMNFGRTPLLGNAAHPRPAHLPQVSERQREALDAIEAVARATQLEITTRAGDMHFINNLAVLHRREGFVDGTDAREKRHLVRMRLRSAARRWDVPAPLQREWEDAFAADGRETWHLEPMPGDAFPLRKYPN